MNAEVYKREDGLWDWRVVADNGNIVATSGGQGYTERNDAREAFERLAAAFASGIALAATG
jgi:uncharacterized protein YegP (UPF0339 family)